MYWQEQYRALRAVNIIKQKWYAKIKGRTFAHGIPQRTYIRIEESMSPTISLEAIFALLIIDAHESISVHTFDVPGAYPHTSLPDDKVVHIKYEGGFVNIMCEVNPEYKKS